MSRSGILIILGALTILAPLSGFPMAFRNLVGIVCGACILGIGLSMRTHKPVVESATPPAPPDEPPPPPPKKGVSPI